MCQALRYEAEIKESKNPSEDGPEAGILRSSS